MGSKENQDLYRLPDEYLSFADQNLPFTIEESLGTFCSTWEINNWLTIQDNQLRGPTFKTDNYEWNVLLYAKGNNDRNYLSLYLENVNCKNGSATNDVCAQFILCLIDPTDPERFFWQVSNHRFNRHESDWGFTQYADLKRFNVGDEYTAPFVVNGTVKIMTIVRLIKDPTGVLWHKFVDYDSKQMTGYVGLYNQGATCYMNSLFQSLFFTNLYRKAVYQIPTENDDPNNSMVLALQRLFYNLQFSDTAVSTTELTKSFGWNSIDSFMQHDVQEFNRLLQDNIEKKMRGTPADGSIKQLFVGRMKSYIKCIDVDYESSRSEDYYDIQLNVKGCRDLEESFNNYVLEETLEGDNKYMAEGYGLQDAKKGVIFESFPPVLHLQLKRFEYDMMKDAMVKINDRHEFPTEIDLKPFLSDSADKSESYKYALHGVLVHTGDLTGGHYFAFVRPTKQDKWFKFDDDRVTPATLNEVLEDNFGGETIHKHPSIRPKKRFTNAYMLVYIRESHQNQVLEEVTQDDIPTHLVERIKVEQAIMEKINKQRAEQHLYMQAYISTDASFLMNTESGFVQFDKNTQGPLGVEVKQVLRSQTLGDFLQEYAEEHNINPGYFRAWYFTNRKNGAVLPDAPFTDREFDFSLEQIGRNISDHPALRIYMETASVDQNENPYFPPPDANVALVFIKVFDPVTQSLNAINKLYIARDGLVSGIEYELITMANLPLGTSIDIYEEVSPSYTQRLNRDATFEHYEIGDGGILCFQVTPTLQIVEALSQQYLCTNVIDYMNYLHNRISIIFTPSKEAGSGISLVLRKDMSYEEVCLQLAIYLNCDPDYILLLHPDRYGLSKRILPIPGMILGDMMALIPKSSYIHDGDGNILWKLYYDVLSISLSEYESRKLIKLNICYPTLSQERYMEYVLPRTATISDLCKEIDPDPEHRIRVYEVFDCKVDKTFNSKDIVSICIYDDTKVYAEIVPKEEYNIGEQDFMISVYHYQRELTRTHSVPFNFLVIKDEKFIDTKKRLKERVGLNDEEWNTVKLNIVNKFTTIPLTSKDDNYKLSDHHFKSTEALGLDHIDPSGRYNIPNADRGLYIKDV